LRAVNATPSLAQATTGSLDALRKYSQAVRLNALGEPRSLGVAREAVALDSTFSTAWSLLAATLANYGGTKSAIDSATTQAYRFRDRLPALERDMVVARYYGLGPGRDRAKGIAAYEAILQRGDTLPTVLINLGEQLRSRREFARAESLNLAAARIDPSAATPLGNAVELQLDQGKLKEAAATNARLVDVAARFGNRHRLVISFAEGDDKTLRSTADSLARVGGDARRLAGLPAEAAIALEDGRFRDFSAIEKELFADHPASSEFVIRQIFFELAVKGPSQANAARLDTAIATVPFRDMPMADRPYLDLAWLLARMGGPDKARAMIGRYRTEMTDTSLRRVQESALHHALGEIALAEGKPLDAVAEYRRGDVASDGAPSSECAGCLAFDVARAYDAARRPDSAAAYFERYLATPFWGRASLELDPVRVPAIRERLGQLYESMGNTDKAAENYRAFVELWKNADADLQPRVADARKRIAHLTPVEKPRP